jgi:hypothetical protein
MATKANPVVDVLGSTVRGLESFALTPSKPADVVDILASDSLEVLLESAKSFLSGEKDVTAGNLRIATAGLDVKGVMDLAKPLTYEWFETVRKQWVENYMKVSGFNQTAADTAWSRFLPHVGVEKPKAGGKAKEMSDKREAEAKRLQAIPDLKQAMAVAFKTGNNTEVEALAKEAKRREKQAEAGAVAELKPLKDQIRTALTACNNKHTLQLVLGKLQGKKVNLQAKK